MLYTQVTEQLAEAAKLLICISDAFSLNLDCAMKYPNRDLSWLSPGISGTVLSICPAFLLSHV